MALEAILGAAIIDVCIIGIVVLFCRMTGRKLPKSIPFSEKLNRLIGPKSSRLDRLILIQQ